MTERDGCHFIPQLLNTNLFGKFLQKTVEHQLEVVVSVNSSTWEVQAVGSRHLSSVSPTQQLSKPVQAVLDFFFLRKKNRNKNPKFIKTRRRGACRVAHGRWRCARNELIWAPVSRLHRAPCSWVASDITLQPEINHGDGICIIYAFNKIYLLKKTVGHSPWNRWYEQSKSLSRKLAVKLRRSE